MSETRPLLPPIVVGVMGNTGIYLIPLLVGAMVADRGFSDREAGLVASADLAGYAVMTFVTAIFLIRIDWRRLAVVGTLVMAIANLATTQVTDATTFAAVRFLSGIGSGILVAIATVALGRTAKPDRSFGMLFAASLLFGTVGLWGLPWLIARAGLNAAYVMLAALAVVVGLFARRLDPGSRDDASLGQVAVSQRDWWHAAPVLLSIAIFWAQQNAIYAYMERIGNASGLSAQFIGFALGLANLSGFFGASLVAWIGGRIGRLLPFILCTVAQLVALWMMAGHLGSTAYLLTVASLSLVWNVVNPLQLGVLADVDRGGRALALSSSVIGFGLASGPAMGAAVLTGENYTPVLLLAAGLAVASIVLLLPAMSRNRLARSATA